MTAETGPRAGVTVRLAVCFGGKMEPRAFAVGLSAGCVHYEWGWKWPKEHLAVVTVEEWPQRGPLEDIYCKGEGFLYKLKKNIRRIYSSVLELTVFWL